MGSKQIIEHDFDAEKVMNMTRKEAISLLGEQNSIRVNEGLQNATLSYSEFERICKESFPISQQAKLVRNVIFNQLSKTEGFNMFESNKEKQAQYAEIERFREKAKNGELTQEELKRLCDKVFGEDSDLSKKLQGEFIAKGKVKQQIHTQVQIDRENKQEETTRQFDEGQEKKSWELEPEEKTRIQRESAGIAQKHREQQEKQPQQNQEQVNQQILQEQVTQQPIMDMGGMEI